MTFALLAASTAVSPPGREYQEDPSVLAFYRDLVEPFGSTVDEQRLRDGRRVFHRDLVDAMVLDEPVTSGTADLVVVAHALPDVHPFTAVASHLNMLLGGEARSFSISEQGLAAPFTALRIISANQRSGRAERAVLAVLEQTTLPTPHPLVDTGNLTDSGALLVIGPGTGIEVETVVCSVPPDEITERLHTLLAEDEQTLLVLGPWARDCDPGDGQGAAVHRVAPGTYCTSVWLDLAHNWQQWQRDYSRIVLCDVDPLTHEGQMALFSAEASA